jgi:DNA-binding response OmpR family regulator
MTPAERIAQLEEEVAYLRSELGLAQDRERLSIIGRALGLSPAPAAILLCLYDTKRTVSIYGLEEAYGSRAQGENNIVSVYICRIRRALPGGVDTVWRLGYRLSTKGRAALDALFAKPAMIAA